MIRGYDGGIEMEARSQIGGRDAATTGAAAAAATATEIGTIGRTQQSHAHLPEALVAGETRSSLLFLFVIKDAIQRCLFRILQKSIL